MKSGIFDIKNDILDETYKYVDSTKYVSWERFFTVYLEDITKDTLGVYKKSKLNKSYLEGKNLNRIRNLLRKVLKI